MCVCIFFSVVEACFRCVILAEQLPCVYVCTLVMNVVFDETQSDVQRSLN